jgi:hypothetical protein
MHVCIDAIVETTALEAQHLETLQKIQQQLESGDSLLFGLLFSPRFPYWVKKIRRDWRLIAAFTTIDGHPVFYLSYLLHRGSLEYRNFLDDPEIWGEQNIRLNEAKLRDCLQKKQTNPTIAPQPLPERLRPWLEKPILTQTHDKVIFESREWVMGWKQLASHWLSFHRVLAHILEIQDYGCRTAAFDLQPAVLCCHDPETNCAIVYSPVHPSNDPNRQIVFLLAAFTHAPTTVEMTQLGRRLGMFGQTVDRDLFATAVTSDDLARFALRSYPDYLVYYPENWYSLEQEEEANLALSGEEEELLRDMSFPAFINGRAGSGKSTMLYYAFAYYCDLYLQGQFKSEVHHLEGCSRGTHRDSLMFTTTKRHPHELLPA